MCVIFDCLSVHQLSISSLSKDDYYDKERYSTTDSNSMLLGTKISVPIAYLQKTLFIISESAFHLGCFGI